MTRDRAASGATRKPVRGLLYAYPHKTAYRPLAPRQSRDVWASEPRSELFLYVHVPFCKMRCGFCNLFTTANPKRDLVTFYLDALRRQAEVGARRAPGRRFARFAIGGGTPTYLNEAELSEVFDIGGTGDGRGPARDPGRRRDLAGHADGGKVALLKARGVERVSIGVQTFIEAEARTPVGRSRARTLTPRCHCSPTRLPDGEHRPHLRPAGSDGRDVAVLASRGAAIRARRTLPLPALRPPADRPGAVAQGLGRYAARVLPRRPRLAARARDTSRCRCGCSGRRRASGAA